MESRTLRRMVQMESLLGTQKKWKAKLTENLVKMNLYELVLKIPQGHTCSTDSNPQC